MRIRQSLQLLAICSLWLAALVGVSAQDAELVRHFDYDRNAPLNLKRIGVQQRANATVYDITYDSPKGGVVPAYLIVPKGRGPVRCGGLGTLVLAKLLDAQSQRIS
jgi:hypothetical protein